MDDRLPALSSTQGHVALPAFEWMRRPCVVFLSHTTDLREQPEGRSFVAAAEAAVTRAGHAVCDMAYFTARDLEPAEYCRSMVARADIYVGIIGLRYGASVRGRPHLSYTEFEFDTATSRRLPRLIFFVREDAQQLGDQTDENLKRQRAFRRRLQESGVTTAWITSPDELEIVLFQALTELRPAFAARAQPPEPRAGVPPDPIAYFVGREAELAELGRRLRRSGHAAVQGLGGVGKTQLVVRYLHRRRREYRDGAFWLRAEHETSLVGDLASLAWRLNLPEREEPEQKRQIESVLHWLRKHRRWLLVLDNLEWPVFDAVQRWLPPGLPGHLLITSRQPIFDERLELKPLPLETSKSFLLQRTGQSDAWAAGAVAESVGCLPLALAQAAAFVEISGRDLASYAELLKTRLVELMEEGKPDDYPRPVASTWQLSFERMEKERPAAASILRLCAFLAPDDIPVVVLEAGACELPVELRSAIEDKVEFDRTIAALRRYSLVGRHGDGLRVHRLVQAVVRESLGDHDRKRWLGAALRMLRAALPEDAWDDHARRPLLNRLVAHADSSVRHTRDEPIEPQAVGWLLHWVGTYMIVRGDYWLARQRLERAVAVREGALGPDHLETGHSLHLLGFLLRKQGELRTVRPFFERALAIYEHVLGPEHPDTLEVLTSLAVLLRGQRELVAARSLMERALATRERALGPTHARVAAGLVELAILTYVQGDQVTAQALAHRALSIHERVEAGSDVSNTLTALAWVLLNPDELTPAVPLLEGALALPVRISARHSGNPFTDESLADFAVMLLNPDELVAVPPLQERATPRVSRAPLSEHRPASRSHIGRILRDHGDPATAKPLLEQALVICDRLYGPDHHETARTRHFLALALADDGQIEEATALISQVLTSMERALGVTHRHTSESLNNLVVFLIRQHRLTSATSVLQDALATREQVLGTEHAHTAAIRYNLAILLMAQSDLANARPHLEQTIISFERLAGEDHHMISRAMHHLAMVLRDQGDLTAARPVLERLVTALERLLGSRHQLTARTRHHLAMVLREQGDLLAARSLLEQAKANLQDALGPGHRFTVDSRRELERLPRPYTTDA